MNTVKSKTIKRAFWFFVILVTVGCSSTKFYEPLNKGEQVLTSHFGGPIATVPGIGSIPLPFTSIGYANGVTDRLTAFGSIYPTSLLFGVGQLDLGVNFGLWESSLKNQGLSITPALNTLVDLYTGTNRFWPQLDVNFYSNYMTWKTFDEFGKLSTIKKNGYYVGLSNWIDPYLTESQGRRNEQFWIPSLQIGHSWNRIRWNYLIECKFLAPIYSNENIVVNYPSVLGDFGALGAYFTLQYKLTK